MAPINNRIRQGDLALSLTDGGTVAARARDEVVPERTADTRSRSRAVLDPAASASLDRAIGRLSDRLSARRPGRRPAANRGPGMASVPSGNAPLRSRPAAKSGRQVPPAAILVDWESWAG